MHATSKLLRTKITYIVIGIYCALICISCRLFYLQVHQVDNLLVRSQKNFLRTQKIVSPRGNITDASGMLLVTNRPVANLYWVGTGRKTLDANDLQLLENVSAITGKPITTDPDALEEIRQAERNCQKILLMNDIQFDQLSKLEEQFPNQENLHIITQFERYYPYKNLASHVLGYLSHIDMDTTGQMGLEKLLEDTLKGHPGTLLKTINSYGRHIAEREVEKATAGQDIHTTLDLTMQLIAENVFPQDASGTIIIMDPEDGSLLTVVSRPHFDPGMFLQPITPDDWQQLQEKRCFLNRAFGACYPPGSIFKLITMSAALEQNIVSVDANVYCGGHTTYCGRDYHCHKLEGHGKLSSYQAVAQSCNILFYDIGKRIDIDLLASYAHTFGLGHKTNVMFAEKEGLIPTRQWKRRTRDERWWQGETLSAAIGQSFILTTPIQVACMISSIFTGYRVKPRILQSEEIVKEELGIRPETLAFLRKTMRLAVTDGTGQRVKTVRNMVIYAKTSTAQTSHLDKRDMGTKYMEHGWFVAHIQYKHHKPFVFISLMENIGTSRATAAITKDFLVAYKKAMDARG